MFIPPEYRCDASSPKTAASCVNGNKPTLSAEIATTGVQPT